MSPRGGRLPAMCRQAVRRSGLAQRVGQEVPIARSIGRHP
jgi:hypothetical protein